LLDVKHPNPERFKEVTGLDQAQTRSIFDYLKATQKPVWIRQVVAHELNSTDEEKAATRAFIEGLNVKRIDRLPYHELGVHKYEELGIAYRGEGLHAPSAEELKL
jgi:pyruvate formate lyase activating enzyme